MVGPDIDIKELLDIPHLQDLIDQMYLATGIPFSLITCTGEILIGAGWQPICINFHRQNAETEQLCIHSDQSIQSRLEHKLKTNGLNENYVLYECPMGLVDAATPLIIKGQYVANVFTGQFLFQNPDRTKFQNQAEKYGFNRSKYMEALEQVPIFTKQEVIANLRFLVKFTKHLADIGLQQLQLQSQHIKLKKMQFSIEKASFPIIWVNQHGDIIYANQRASTMYEYSPQELNKMHITEINTQFSKEEWRSRVKTYHENEELMFETYHQTKSGHIFPVEVTINLMQVDNEKIIVGFIHNISERKQAQRALQESEVKYRKITENSPYGIWITNQSGEIEYINRTFTQIFGYVHDDIPTIQKWFEVAYADQQIQQKAQETYQTDRNAQKKKIINPRVFTVSCKNGEQKTIAFRIIPFGKQKSISLFEDITEKLKIEERRLQAQKIESIALLAGGIAHDFNNILTGILGNVEILKDYNQTQPDYREILGDLVYATQRARDLTNQLLTFSKGGNPIKKVQSLGKILRSSAKFSFAGSKSTYSLKIEENLPNVNVDTGQISQVFNNLFLNAIQAMPEGGHVSIHAYTIDHSRKKKPTLDQRDFIQIDVEDSGHGIKEEHQSRILEPYFSTKPNGTGLGLSTAYSIIKHHGGQLTFTSHLGEGTTFHVILPITYKQPTSQKIPSSSLTSMNCKVLIMDDEVSIHKAMNHLLMKFGCSVDSAFDGEMAVEKLKLAQHQSDPYNIIFLDLIIPGGMGGLKTLQKVKKIAPDVKTVVFSGYSKDPIMTHFHKYGFDFRLLKPFTVQELKTLLYQVNQAISS